MINSKLSFVKSTRRQNLGIAKLNLEYWEGETMCTVDDEMQGKTCIHAKKMGKEPDNYFLDYF